MSDADQRLEELDTEPVMDARLRTQERAIRALVETYNEHLQTGQPIPPTALEPLREAFAETDRLPAVLRQPLRTIGELGDWFGESPPRREYLLRRGDVGALPAGIVGMLAAPGGRGKSYLLCQLALSVATGRAWLDTFEIERPGRVVLALAEEEPEEQRRRLFYAAHALQLDEAELRAAQERIVPLGLHGQPVGLVEGENRSVEPSETHRRLQELLADEEHSLLVFDPLSRFCPDVESNNAAATAAIQAFEALARGPGRPTVIIAHHSNKQSRVEGSGASANMVRGVTGLTDAVRWEAQLTGKAEDDLALHFSKGNYGPAGEPIPLERTDYGVIRAIDPEERAERQAEERRERLKELRKKIRDAAIRKPGLTKNQLMAIVGGQKARARDAIELMIVDGDLVNEGTDRKWSLCAA